MNLLRSTHWFGQALHSARVKQAQGLGSAVGPPLSFGGSGPLPLPKPPASLGGGLPSLIGPPPAAASGLRSRGSQSLIGPPAAAQQAPPPSFLGNAWSGFNQGRSSLGAMLAPNAGPAGPSKSMMQRYLVPPANTYESMMQQFGPGGTPPPKPGGMARGSLQSSLGSNFGQAVPPSMQSMLPPSLSAGRPFSLPGSAIGGRLPSMDMSQIPNDPFSGNTSPRFDGHRALDQFSGPQRTPGFFGGAGPASMQPWQEDPTQGLPAPDQMDLSQIPLRNPYTATR